MPFSVARSVVQAQRAYLQPHAVAHLKQGGLRLQPLEVDRRVGGDDGREAEEVAFRVRVGMSADGTDWSREEGYASLAARWRWSAL